MSRSFTPPSSLSKDEVRTIANVRRDIWTSSFQGMAYGSLTGLTGHLLVKAQSNRTGYLAGKLNRNTLMLAVLGGASLGSFLAATVTGKNEVHQLHPIYKVGAVDMTTTRKKVDLAKATPEEIREDRQRNRYIRRMSLRDQIERGHGLNDSRGGQWIHEEQFPEEFSLEDRQRNRGMRRQTLKSALEGQHGGLKEHAGRERWVN